MKELQISMVVFFAFATSAPGQGLVQIANSAETLVSVGYDLPHSAPTAPGPGFFYGLLTAPVGTTDPSAFTFSGLYATNSSATTGGRFFGGPLSGTPVPGWLPHESMAFEVAGWSASLGRDWNLTWLSLPPDYGFGLSAIGSGFAGGHEDSTGFDYPVLHLFGASPSIPTGFLIVVPEPQVGLLCSGALLVGLVTYARRKEQ